MASDSTGAAQSTPPVAAAAPASAPERAPSRPPPSLAAGALAAGALAASRALRARRRPRRRHPGRVRHDPGARRGAPQLALARLALLAIVGPGLIVMVGDNDAGGVATYSQAGQNYGTSLLWVLLLLIPVLIVNQEMVVRLGAVTGVGHARLIKERFGRFWGWFSVDRPVHPELPHRGDRVHRGQPSARLLRGLRVHRGAARGGGPDRGDRHRQLPALGALDVRVRVRQPAGDPAVLPGPSEGRSDRPRLLHSGHLRAVPRRFRCC